MCWHADPSLSETILLLYRQPSIAHKMKNKQNAIKNDIVIKRSSTVNKEVIKKGILSIRNKAVNTE